MSSRISRLALARYGTEQLLSGKKPEAEIARELAAVLIDSSRVDELELLLDDIAWELESRGKLARADVTTASALSEKHREQIEGYVKRSAGVEHVVINEITDKSVVAGVRIDTAAHSWDRTAARLLSDLREVF